MPDFGEEMGKSLAAEIVRVLINRRKTIAIAESCTAGLVADLIARFPGASKVFWGSFVTYTADAKVRMLGVPKELIETHGEVSRPVALAMAEGAFERSGASWALSITGLAGPGGEGAPIGTVWIGLAGPAGRSAGSPAGLLARISHPEAKSFLFTGNRNEVRAAAAAAALKELLERILTAGEFLV